jgi:hypothetical protein
VFAATRTVSEPSVATDELQMTVPNRNNPMAAPARRLDGALCNNRKSLDGFMIVFPCALKLLVERLVSNRAFVPNSHQ